MAIIRRLSCFDIPKIKKMVSYLGDTEGTVFTKVLKHEILLKTQFILPLKFCFLPESFVLVDNKGILGLITVAPTRGNPYKINVTRLIFLQNMYDVGKQLVEFVVARFGAKGALSFQVLVDECHEELTDLFINGCGFRQCSQEVLWKVDLETIDDSNLTQMRVAQNFDSKYIARLFNGEIQPLYRNSLERNRNEFKEPVFAGFSQNYKNRYVLEEPIKHKIVAYLSITTDDNLNYILDLCTSSGFEFDYDAILNFAIKEIKIRKSKFSLFIKQKKYTKTSERLEEFFIVRDFKNIQSQNVLVKDYYKPIKQSLQAQVFSFGEKLVTQDYFKH